MRLARRQRSETTMLGIACALLIAFCTATWRSVCKSPDRVVLSARWSWEIIELQYAMSLACFLQCPSIGWICLRSPQDRNTPQESEQGIAGGQEGALKGMKWGGSFGNDRRGTVTGRRRRIPRTRSGPFALMSYVGALAGRVQYFDEPATVDISHSNDRKNHESRQARQRTQDPTRART